MRVNHRIAAAAALVLLSVAPSTAQQSVQWSGIDRVLVESDTFAFRMNGQQLGTQVVSLARTPEGFRFEETSTLAHMNQTTVVLFGGDPVTMRSVRQNGQAMGNEMRIAVDYAADRASGSALTPASGPTEITVDAELPAGVIDDNVLTALLPAIDWSADTDVTIPVFHSGRNTTGELHLRVTGTETTVVPAGTFETYRVEATGGDASLVFFVEHGAPHRLVRLEIVGAPIEVVRLN